MTEQGKPQITRIAPEAIWQEGKAAVPGYRVEFTSPDGHQSYVHVPRSDDVHEVAARAVEEEAARLDQLGRAYPRRQRTAP